MHVATTVFWTNNVVVNFSHSGIPEGLDMEILEKKLQGMLFKYLPIGPLK